MTETFTEWETMYDRIRNLVQRHEDWRARCPNLCAAENAVSRAVRAMLSSDLAGRYGDYTGRDLTARPYFGTREVIGIEETAASLAREVFRAQYVELRPISGHVAGNTVILGLCEPGDLVL